jgi:SAP domain
MEVIYQMKAAQLKTLCKERGLKVSGKKAELQERLRDHFLASAAAMASTYAKESSMTNADVDSGNDGHTLDCSDMTVDDLRDALATRNLPRTGTRDELMTRLQVDVEFLQGLTSTIVPENRDECIPLSAAIEISARQQGGAIASFLAEMDAKSKTESKDVEVKIESLGLEPLIYTPGGAHSVTAPVLKKLAGDPFADPPRYGTVSESCEVTADTTPVTSPTFLSALSTS